MHKPVSAQDQKGDALYLRAPFYLPETLVALGLSTDVFAPAQMCDDQFAELLNAALRDSIAQGGFIDD